MAIKAATTREALIALINKANNTTLTDDDIKLSAPTPIDGVTDEDTRNTTVEVTGTDPNTLTGKIVVKYIRRKPIEHFVDDVVTYGYFDESADEESVKKAVAEGVLTGRTIPFDADSYTFSTVIALDAEDDESQDGRFNWKVVLDFTNSYVLYGTQTVLVSSKTRELSSIIKTTELGGFYYNDVRY